VHTAGWISELPTVAIAEKYIKEHATRIYIILLMLIGFGILRCACVTLKL
jgi:hypothetical protein